MVPIIPSFFIRESKSEILREVVVEGEKSFVSAFKTCTYFVPKSTSGSKSAGVSG